MGIDEEKVERTLKSKRRTIKLAHRRYFNDIRRRARDAAEKGEIYEGKRPVYEGDDEEGGGEEENRTTLADWQEKNRKMVKWLTRGDKKVSKHRQMD